LNRHPQVSAGGSLPHGAWYYVVSAVFADGEGLPSNEAVARDAQGAVTIRWATVPGAISYNIYRFLASDGRSQSERLLAVGVQDTSFTDTGEGSLAPAPGNLRGRGAAGGNLAQGKWTYRVSAVTAAGETLAGYPLQTEVALGENAVELAWDEVPGAISYRLYRSAQVNDASGATYLLAADIVGTTFTDDGSASPNTNVPAPDGFRPLAPGSLSKWQILKDAEGNPFELNTPREGLRAVVVTLPYDDDADPATPPVQRAFIYVVGGRPDNATVNFYLDTVERAEINLLTGELIPSGAAGADWTLDPETLNNGRAFHTLLSSQGRLENPGPGDHPPQVCDDVDGDGYDDIECGGSDCNDLDPNIHPGAEETCGDGIDQDCDGQDTPCTCVTDLDGDGFISTAECGGIDCCDAGTESIPGCSTDTAASIHPGAQETCGDGIDQDCDGRDLECACADNDHDGYSDITCGGTDCNDNDASIHPGAQEVCGDGIDQNCDGQDTPCGCPDRDGDGYTDKACGGRDCNDNDPTTHPGAYDWCDDGIDQNCDGFDPVCFWNPHTPKAEEKIFLVAVKGDDRFSTPTNGGGLDTVEVCTVIDDSTSQQFGGLSAWTLQTERSNHITFGHEGLLYIDYVFSFGGATFENVTTNNVSAVRQSWGQPFDPQAAINLVVGRDTSAAGQLYSERAYYALVRLFSRIVAFGGIAGTQLILDTWAIKQ